MLRAGARAFATIICALPMAALLTSCTVPMEGATPALPGTPTSATPEPAETAPVPLRATDESMAASSFTPTPTEALCSEYDIMALGRPWSGSGDYGYYLICADGSSVRLLTDRNVCAYHEPAVSQATSLIAFACDNKIYVFNLSGEIVQEIEADEYVLSPSWSPEGTYLAYIGDRQSFEIVHLSTGTISRSLIPSGFEHPVIGSPLEPEYVSLTWSPNGENIGLLTNYSSLYVLDVNCDDESFLCSTHNIRPVAEFNIISNGQFSWSPDGSELVAVCYKDSAGRSTDMSLCIIDLQGHVVREYTPQELGLDFEALGSPMWSPDGKEIAFLADASLWLLSLSDDSVQNLTQETMATDISGIAWLP
jgi:WD40 repeat protein